MRSEHELQSKGVETKQGEDIVVEKKQDEQIQEEHSKDAEPKKKMVKVYKPPIPYPDKLQEVCQN